VRRPSAPRQRLGARPFRAGVVQRHAETLDISVGADEVRPVLLHLRLEQRTVEARQYLAALDDRIEVGSERFDGARHLRPHLNAGDCLKSAGRADGVDDGAASHWRRDEGRRGLDLARVVERIA
jgi:hypothetical protein